MHVTPHHSIKQLQQLQNQAPRPALVLKFRAIILARDGWIDETPAVSCREQLNQDVIGNLVEALRSDSTSVPVIHVYLQDGTYWLADGTHRVAAARKLGHSVIRACVRPGSQDDATREAAGSNRYHGAVRTRADKRRAVAAVLRLPGWSGRSDRLIAGHVGVDAKTVADVRRELEATDEIAAAEQRISADGRQRPARRNHANAIASEAEMKQNRNEARAPMPAPPASAVSPPHQQPILTLDAQAMASECEVTADAGTIPQMPPTPHVTSPGTSAADPVTVMEDSVAPVLDADGIPPAEGHADDGREFFLQFMTKGWNLDWLAEYDAEDHQQLRIALQRMLSALDDITHPRSYPRSYPRNHSRSHPRNHHAEPPPCSHRNLDARVA